MIKTTILLDTRSRTNKGHPIKIRVYKDKQYKYIPLKEYSEKKDWQGDNVLKSHPEYRTLSNKIRKRASLLVEQEQFCMDNRLSLDDSYNLIKTGLNRELEIFLLEKRLKELKNKGGVGILKFIDTRIGEKESLNQSTLAYISAKNIFTTYLRGVDEPLNNINYEWINSFLTHKRADGVSSSSGMAYLSTLRAVYKEAQKRESLGVKQDNPFLGVIKSGRRAADIPMLTKEDFNKILAYDGKRKIYFVLFVFQFLIGGHDLVDISLLEWSNIRNGRLKFRRWKNRSKPAGDTLIDNKLLPMAVKIINEYGTKKNKRIFGFIPDTKTNYEDYRRFRGLAIKHLQEVGSKIGLSGKIGTKTPRYVFRTTAGNLQIDTLTIMTIQGHTPRGVTFNYQGALPYNVVDKVHERIVNEIIKT